MTYLDRTAAPVPDLVAEGFSGPAQDPAASAHDPMDSAQELLNVLTHKLSQPLTALRCGLDMALIRQGTDRRTEILSAIEEVERIHSFMRSFQQLVNSTTRIELAPIDLRREVKEAIDFLAPLAAERSVGFHCMTDARAVLALSDTESVRQALYVVLENAISRSKPGSSVTLTMSSSSSEATIRIRDQVSASETLKELLSAPLRCLDQHRGVPEDFPLAIAARLLDSAGARMEVTANEQGRAFLLRWPRAK